MNCMDAWWGYPISMKQTLIGGMAGAIGVRRREPMG